MEGLLSSHSSAKKRAMLGGIQGVPTGLDQFQHSENTTNRVRKRHLQNQSLTPLKWREIASFREHREQLNYAPAFHLFSVTLLGSHGDSLTGPL